MAGQFGKKGVVAAARVRVPAVAVAAPAAAEIPAAPRARRNTPAPWFELPAVSRSFTAKPISTILILILLVVVFAMELRVAPPLTGLTPSLHAQLAVGAINPDSVFKDHQYWRLFTGPLMHGSLAHIVGNAVVFALVGFLLEPLIGSAWFAAIFFFAAFGGAVVSVCFNSPNIVSTGASGAIMGLVIATFVCSFHDGASERCTRMQMMSVRLAIPALLPAFNTASKHIDYSAHAGGALAGAFMGLLLLAMWPSEESRPAHRPVAFGIVAFGLLAAAFGFSRAAATPPDDNATVMSDGLIPEAVLPSDPNEGIAQSADLVARYPDDPRGHLFRGMHFLQIDDAADANSQFRTALDDIPHAAGLLNPQFASVTRLLLAATLVAEGRTAEAIPIAKPACADGVEIDGLSSEMQFLQQHGVCQ